VTATGGQSPGAANVAPDSGKVVKAIAKSHEKAAVKKSSKKAKVKKP
jgi:hypothetical protein